MRTSGRLTRHAKVREKNLSVVSTTSAAAAVYGRRCEADGIRGRDIGYGCHEDKRSAKRVDTAWFRPGKHGTLEDKRTADALKRCVLPKLGHSNWGRGRSPQMRLN